MAKRKRSRAPETRAPRRAVSRIRSGARRVYSRSKGMFGGKIRWGEAALAAIVGYEGDKILEPGMSLFVPAIESHGWGNAFYNAAGDPNVTQNEAYSMAVNKILGTVAVAKVAYDVVKSHKLDDNDMNVYLPYAIGTVFDPASKKSSDSGGAW